MKHVVVVGAGLGGLAGGVRLLQRGHRVTILEKEPRVGGYAIAFKREGYTFDLALHVVPAGGPGQEYRTLMEKLGIDDQVKFIRLKTGFEVFLGGFHFQMPNDLDGLIAKLTDRFPGERIGLKRFHDDLEKHVKIYGPVFAYGQSKLSSIPPFLLKLPSFLKHSRLSTKDYLKQFFQDSRLMSILFQPAAFMGIPMTAFPTVNFMMMFHLLLKNGMYTIRGGGQQLSNALKNQFTALGGELSVNCEVKKLHCKNGVVSGVETAAFSQLECDAVIAACNLPELVNSLIGREYFSPAYINNLENLAPSVSVLALNLGLDCPPSGAGIHNHIAMAFPDPDIDRCFANQEADIAPLGFSVTANANSDPECSAGAANTVSIIGGTAREKWLTMENGTYLTSKKEVTQSIIARAARYFPRLPEHIVVADLATPKTMSRYTGNPGGAIMGFNCTVGEHRKIMQTGRLPMRNVDIGSAWTNRLGGFMQSMKSGIIAAEKI